MLTSEIPAEVAKGGVTIRSLPEGALTYADLASFPDDGLRRELLDGELIVSPSPFTRHQEIVLRLAVVFSLHLAERGGGRVFIGPLDVVLSDTTVVGVPALIIEVVPESRMDRVRKPDIYFFAR